jgi:hypothetical protein
MIGRATIDKNSRLELELFSPVGGHVVVFGDCLFKRPLNVGKAAALLPR